MLFHILYILFLNIWLWRRNKCICSDLSFGLIRVILYLSADNVAFFKFFIFLLFLQDIIKVSYYWMCTVFLSDYKALLSTNLCQCIYKYCLFMYKMRYLSTMACHMIQYDLIWSDLICSQCGIFFFFHSVSIALLEYKHFLW